MWRAGFEEATGQIWRRTILAKTCPGIGRISVNKDRQGEGLARMQVRARSIEQQRCTRIFICEGKGASSDCRGSRNWRDEHASPERILSCSHTKNNNNKKNTGASQHP